MSRSGNIALGLSALVVGAIARTAQTSVSAPERQAPAANARPAFVVRQNAEVRQAPVAGAPVLGHLSRGDHVMVDPTDTGFPGFTSLVREWLDEGGVRFARNLGWIASNDVSFSPPAVVALGVPRPPGIPIGTIGGHHSLAETRDLLAVVDYRFREIADAITESRSRTVDPAVRASLDTDWQSLNSRWTAARTAIARNLLLKRLAFPIWFTADMVPTEDEWTRTLSYVEGQELMKGSLQDITLRLERILGRKILFEHQPGQTTTDIDLDLFKDLDAGIRAGEDTARRAAEATRQAVTSPLGLAIGTTLLTVGGAVIALTFLPEIRAARAARR